MNVSAWEERRDPERLLGVMARNASARKLRLLTCAIIRHAPFHPDGRTIWDLLPTYSWYRPGREGGRYNLNCQEAVGVAERWADGVATPDEWEIACGVGSGATWCAEADTFGFDAVRFEGSWFRYAAAKSVEAAVWPREYDLGRRLTRYRGYLTAHSSEVHPENGAVVCSLIRDSLSGPQRWRPINADWHSSAVRELTTGAYEHHQKDVLPILADALEEAGCTDQAMLRHCREPGVHARGCWVLDRILGRG